MRLSLLLLLLLAAPVFAQDAPAEAAPESVVLRGWGLTDGAAVTTTVHTLRRAASGLFGPGQEPSDTTAVPVQELMIYTARTDSTRTTIVAADAHGPTAIEEYVFLSDLLEDVHEGSEILSRGRRTEPLSGTHYRLDRTADGWSRSFLRVDDPSEEQHAALAEVLPAIPIETPQYPAEPVAVGAFWTVDRAGLEAIYGPLAEGTEHRLVYQLDSLGTFFGRPAAFLSYGLHVTLDQGAGRLLQRDEVGMVVRLTDVFVDVLARRQGTFRSEVPDTLPDGSTGRAVLRGSVQSHTERFLVLPAQAER